MSRLIDVAAVLDRMAKALAGTEQGEACAFAVRLMRERESAAPANQGGSPMSRDKILAKLPRMSAACLRANGLTQPPAVDMSHDPHDVTPAKPTLRQKRGPKLNKTEAAFEAYLRANTERTIHTQDITLTLGNGVRYTPDFSTWSHLHGQIPCFYEVKGFMRDDAAVKLKVAAAKFQHFNFYLVFRDRTQTSGWRIEEVLP